MLHLSRETAFDLPGQVEPVDRRHIGVDQRHREGCLSRRGRCQEFKGRLRSGNRCHVHFPALEHFLDRPAIGGVVFDDQSSDTAQTGGSGAQAGCP